MSSIPDQIADKFLSTLAESKQLTEKQLSDLREALAGTTKVRATYLERIFSSPREKAEG